MSNGKFTTSELRGIPAELSELRHQLTVSRAREVHLREALEPVAKSLLELKDSFAERGARPETAEKRVMWDLAWSAYEKLLEVTNQPQDTTALEAMIQKAGEVMRERCEAAWKDYVPGENIDDAIRALPGVTLDELK